MTSDIDIHYMRMALNYARRGIGRVAPNPSVGCVIVRDDMIVGRGRTAEGGRPHAEAAALDHAGELARGATAYVTLEPCAEHGREGPCAAALIKAGVAQVVVACHDLNPVVYKKGIAILEDAGIHVTFGVLEEDAIAMHKGFFLRVTENRPYITLKCAISADGKIAEAVGKRTQISGKLASRYMHLLRSQHDAILVGQMTEFVDKPQLTTRIEGYEHESLRVVLDKNVGETSQELAEKGITRLLVEGGAKTHTSFLKTGLYDEVQLIKSPKILGEQGVDAADFMGERNLILQKTRPLGEDVLEIYARAH